MKIDNETLKVLFWGYANSNKFSNQKNCPSSVEIINSFERSTSIRKKTKIVDHITECSLCREEFLLYLKLKEHELLSNKRTDNSVLSNSQTLISRPIYPALSLFKRYGYVLITFGIIISLMFLFIQQKELSKIPRTRITGISLLYPISAHFIPDSLTFRWKKQRASQYYILELFDDALLPIWTSDKIFDAHIRLPDEICQKLLQKKFYFWMITAFSDMQKIEESRLARFFILKKEEKTVF